ncbi:MAG: hypothetical protein ACHQ49_07290 [Elusimicrobiota bacterium]
MRTLLKVSLPVEPANKAVKDGSLPKTIQTLVQELRPEASYFFAEHGQRTALFVFDLKDPTQIPSVVEPLFTRLNAAVELFPVMNADELKSGLEKTVKNLQREPVLA